MLLVTTHHIICDGWSLEVLGHEVAQYLRRVAAGPAVAAARTAGPIRRLRRLAARLPAGRGAGVAAGLLAQEAGGSDAAGTAHRPAARGPRGRTSKRYEFQIPHR